MNGNSRLLRSFDARRGSRGQLLSVDFLVAVSITAVCIGALLQLNEFSHSRADAEAFLADNKAEAIASFLHGGGSAAVPAGNVYCGRRVLLGGEVQGVAGAGGCDSFSCGRAVFTARRIESCFPSPSATPPAPTPPPVACVLEVRTC